MAKLTLPYDIINDSPANATPLQSDLVRIEQHVNQEVIERGGTVAMTAQLKLVGNPVAALDAAPKQYVDSVLPIGTITMYGGAVAPVGGAWLMCDNTEYEVALYPALAAVLNNAVSGRFRVPDLVARIPLGTGGGYAMNAKGGTPDAIVPAHSHTIDHGHSASSGVESSDHTHGFSGMSGAADRPLWTSSDGDHNHVVALAQSQGFLVSGIGATPADLQQGGSAYGFAPTTSNAGAHSHTVTDHLHAYNGTTGGISVNHTHGITVNNMYGSSGSTGISGNGQNLPPYYVVSFIIRAA